MKIAVALCVALALPLSPALAQRLAPGAVAAIHPTKGSTLQELLGVGAGLHSDRMSIALFTLVAGAAYPASHNIASEEIFLIRSGEGTVWLDGRPTRVSSGDMVRIPPGIDHRIAAASGTGLSFYAISAPPFVPADLVLSHQP